MVTVAALSLSIVRSGCALASTPRGAAVPVGAAVESRRTSMHLVSSRGGCSSVALTASRQQPLKSSSLVGRWRHVDRNGCYHTKASVRVYACASRQRVEYKVREVYKICDAAVRSKLAL